jgi:hypothetical protein
MYVTYVMTWNDVMTCLAIGINLSNFFLQMFFLCGHQTTIQLQVRWT